MGAIKHIFGFIRKKIASVSEKGRFNYAKKIGVKIDDGAKLIGMPDFGSEPWLIEIKSGAKITAGVQFITHDGSVSVLRALDEKYSKILKFGKIIVEEGAFIGNHAVILPNVRIGKGSVVGACSLVSKDVPDGTVVAGNPAKIIATTNEVAEKWLKNTPEYDNAELQKSKRKVSTEIADYMWDLKHGKR
ncbi:MAG: acyltransferase [Clostridia bacterium]|nr:acyltransferase [Clostridia bacterium]